ncbi:MAG: hypothetical protein PHY73_05690 [Candidatus Omnitrophica bacterium]|nr:hypothetical protein [Candidatus Omnitrophota bacterium]
MKKQIKTNKQDVWQVRIPEPTDVSKGRKVNPWMINPSTNREEKTNG